MTLAAENITLLRGGHEVVNAVSAALEPGTITAITGPNGAGKSSLLMALAGLLEPAGGRVALDGEDLAAIDRLARARAIGYLPQASDIAWDVSVESVVRLGRMPHRETRGAAHSEAVHAAMDALDLGELASRPVSRLSGGEKARVLLARVLAGEPRWILADEPLAALDLAHQLNLVRYLRASAEAGRGVVIVLHDLALAMNHADRVLVLDNGQLAADDEPGAALSVDVVERVWKVKAEWSGKAGRRAFIACDPD